MQGGLIGGANGGQEGQEAAQDFNACPVGVVPQESAGLLVAFLGVGESIEDCVQLSVCVQAMLTLNAFTEVPQSVADDGALHVKIEHCDENVFHVVGLLARVPHEG